MLKKIVLVLVVLVLALLAYAATRPDSFRVQRGVTVQAPSGAVFALVHDFHEWARWSPWARLDPAMKATHLGATAGKGAVYEWEGNDQVGKGRMELTESTRPTKIVIKLDFLEPFEAHNTTEFLFEPNGDATNVIWTMQGPSPFVSRIMGIFVDIEGRIGKDFEQGLANLKATAEK